VGDAETLTLGDLLPDPAALRQLRGPALRHWLDDDDDTPAAS